MNTVKWALALVVAAAAAVFGPVPSSEALLQSSFTIALAGSKSNIDGSAKRAPVAGSEEFWLSQMQPEPGAPLAKAVAAGDKIAMTLGGLSRTLEVASVAEFAPNITMTDFSGKPGKFLMVTAKDVGEPNALPVRFVIEIEEPRGKAALTSKPRTL